MKNKKTLKVLALALAFVLVAGIAVGATMAYLTSTPKAVTNTFTIGKLAITLDEQKVTPYGEKANATGEVDANSTIRVDNNGYKLIPGHTYIKDPTIHVQPDSEKCYLFVKIVDQIADIEDATTVADQITANNWIPLDGVDGVYYKEQAAVAAGASAVDVKIFANFKIKTDADVSSYDGKTITVTAYAIQFDGFESNVAGAWSAVSTAAATPTPTN